MSLFYNLYIETDKSPLQITAIAAGVFGLQPKPHFDEFTFGIPGFSFAGGEMAYRKGSIEFRKDTYDLWLEAYGFVPTVEFEIYHYPNHDPELTYDGIKKTAVEILLKEAGNAVLLYNGGLTLLERIDGNIACIDKDYDWLKEELTDAGLEYETRHLKFKANF